MARSSRRQLVGYLGCSLLAASALSCGGSDATPQSTFGTTGGDQTASQRTAFLYLGGGASLSAAYRLDEASGSIQPIPFSADVTGVFEGHPSGPFVYFGHYVNLSVEARAYRVDTGTGALSASGDPRSIGNEAANLKLDPGGDFLYSVNGCPINDPCRSVFRAFRLDRTSGAILDEVPGSPFPVGHQVIKFLTDPAGRFVYLVSGFGQWPPGIPKGIWGFKVDRTAGTVALIAGSPFLPDLDMIDYGARFAFHPSGPWVFATPGSSALWTLHLDEDTGALSKVASIDPRGRAGYPVVDAEGRFLYVSVQSNSVFADAIFPTLRTFAIDPETGILTPSGGPFQTKSWCEWLMLHPSNRLVLAERRANGSVAPFARDLQTGDLTALAEPATTMGTAPLGSASALRLLRGGRWLLGLGSDRLFLYEVAGDQLSVTSRGSVAAPYSDLLAVVYSDAR
jgi:6-phosphogluconolactonase (cycloisomerase 2 family)